MGCIIMYMLETLKVNQEIKQHFQCVAQNVWFDKNSDYFAAHFAQHFTKKSSQ